MKASGSSDKKIFYGLVTLIVLTILLILGITYIQRPQTTGSDAQEFAEKIDTGEDAGPTSVPLQSPGEECTKRQLEDGSVIEECVTTPSGSQEGSGNIPEEETSQTESGDTTPLDQPVETGSETVDTTSGGENDEIAAIEPSPTEPLAEGTSGGIEGTAGEEAQSPSPTEEPLAEGTLLDPTPTETLLADGGDNGTGIETGTAGSGNLDEGLDYGYGGTETTTDGTITYVTSTPVPTAADQLPAAGTVHITLLVFTVSLLLVLLGLAL